MLQHTLKCHTCGAPYKFHSMTVADQSACPKCVAYAEAQAQEYDPYTEATQALRRQQYFHTGSRPHPTQYTTFAGLTWER